MDGPVAYSALASGDIDAIWSTGQILSIVDRGIAKVIYTTKNEPDVYKTSGYVVVNSKFEQKYPEVVQRVVNVLVKQAAWESNPANKDQLFKQWAKSGLPYANIVKINAGIDLKRNSAPIFDAYNVSLIKQKLKAGQDLKLIRGNIDVDSWVEPKYVNNALKTLNLQSYWKPLNANGQ